MGQTTNGRWCLSSSSVGVSRLSSVTLPAGGPAGRLARGWSGGRHSTAGQYGYVPLGRHLVTYGVVLFCVPVIVAFCEMELYSESNYLCCMAGGVDGCGQSGEPRATVFHGAGQGSPVPAAAVAGGVHPGRRPRHRGWQHIVSGSRRLRVGLRRPAGAVPAPPQLVRAPVGRGRRRRGRQRRRAQRPRLPASPGLPARRHDRGPTDSCR